MSGARASTVLAVHHWMHSAPPVYPCFLSACDDARDNAIHIVKERFTTGRTKKPRLDEPAGALPLFRKVREQRLPGVMRKRSGHGQIHAHDNVIACGCHA